MTMTTTRTRQPAGLRALTLRQTLPPLEALAVEAAPAGDPWAATAGTNRPPPLRPDPARRYRPTMATPELDLVAARDTIPLPIVES